MRRATIWQIITIDGSQNNILQFEILDGSRNVSRLSTIYDTVRLATLHITESASACAELTHYHESRCAATPALTNVRAVSLFAHCVQ
jgi:hypothetical protein